METNDSTNNAESIEIELDDVEAHGLKEVAAGIGAAAVLGGAGAGAALAASSGYVPIPPASTAKQAVHNVNETEDKARAVLKHKTPAPPADVTVDAARIYPAKLPKVHVPPTTPPAFNLPVGTGTKPVVDKVKKSAHQAQDKAADAVEEIAPSVKLVPPITGPVI
jgi:hypothetical protein